MERQKFAGRGEIAFRRMIHFVIVMDAFFIETHQPRGTTDHIPFNHLLIVGDVVFHREGTAGAVVAIILVQPDIGEKFIDRMIEHQRVISHVHMAVVIDPVRNDCFRPQLQRGCVGHGQVSFRADPSSLTTRGTTPSIFLSSLFSKCPVASALLPSSPENEI